MEKDMNWYKKKLCSRYALENDNAKLAWDFELKKDDNIKKSQFEIRRQGKEDLMD